MTIRVEFIRRRPGGRITVRPTLYEKDELSLGRATDCDVHLGDLRVGLHHARLIQLNQNKIRIEANGDHRVRVDGSQVRRRDIEIDSGSQIRIGPYQLSIASNDDADELTVSIELIEPPTPVRDKRDEEAVFSMKGYAPGKRPTAWLLVSLILAIFLATPIILHFTAEDNTGVVVAETEASTKPFTLASNQHWLAGDMSSAHANLTKDCRSCHVEPFTRVMDETCLTCHEEMRDHANPHAMTASRPVNNGSQKWMTDLRSGLNIPEGRCGSCHFEHNGTDGVTPVKSTLCVDCHTDMDERYPETKFVNVENFARRHPEFSPAVILDPTQVPASYSRVSLVDRPKENNGLEFPHEFHLSDEEVARKFDTLPTQIRARYGSDLDCVDCHQADAAGALIKPIVMETHCADCHSLAFSAEGEITRNLPHGEPAEVRSTLEDFYLAQATNLLLGDQARVVDRQLSREARQRRERLRTQAFNDARTNTEAMVSRIFSEDGLCLKCHANEDPGDSASTQSLPKITPVQLTNQYMPYAHFSHAEHMTGNVRCTTCHQAETSKTSDDVLMPSITVCRACHDDTKGRTGIASGCLTCHSYHDESEETPLMNAKWPSTPVSASTSNNEPAP